MWAGISALVFHSALGVFVVNLDPLRSSSNFEFDNTKERDER
jgi:hypothetical protein